MESSNVMMSTNQNVTISQSEGYVNTVNPNFSVKKPKLKANEDKSVIIHKKQIDPSEHIKLVFPSFSNEVNNKLFINMI